MLHASPGRGLVLSLIPLQQRLHFLSTEFHVQQVEERAQLCWHVALENFCFRPCNKFSGGVVAINCWPGSISHGGGGVFFFFFCLLWFDQQ